MSSSTSSAFKGIPNKFINNSPVVEEPLITEVLETDETLLEDGSLEEQQEKLLKKEESVLERKIEVLQELKNLIS